LLLKVFDSRSVLAYDHHTEEFELMNFIDRDEFKENFNNFIQLNYQNKLFVVTGSPCQRFYIYDFESNEMQLINILKFSHNWWPILVIDDKNTNLALGKINIYCLSGSYTKNCEELCYDFLNPNGNGNQSFSKTKTINLNDAVKNVLENDVGLADSLNIKKQDSKNSKNMENMEKNDEKVQLDTEKLKDVFEWKAISATNQAHGQGSAIIHNKDTLYVFYGYDSNHNPTSVIERMNIESKTNWEELKFKNPNNISSFLIYHSLVSVDDNTCYVLGGMKEINEIDNIYKVDFETSELLQTKFKIPISNVKFIHEKIFYHMDISMNGKKTMTMATTQEKKSNVNLNTTIKKGEGEKLMKTEGEKFMKSVSSIGNNEKERRQDFVGLFDALNNVHFLKIDKMEYVIKQYNKK